MNLPEPHAPASRSSMTFVFSGTGLAFRYRHQCVAAIEKCQHDRREPASTSWHTDRIANSVLRAAAFPEHPGIDAGSNLWYLPKTLSPPKRACQFQAAEIG